MRVSRVLSGATSIAATAMFVLAASPRPTQSVVSTPPRVIVRFFADDFWLNLHHFLYVLGRAQAGAPERQRAAVAGAPNDQDSRLVALAFNEQTAWRNAVTGYAVGLSKLDTVFDRQLATITGSLARLGSATTLNQADTALVGDVAATLARAGPIYRDTWWPAHHAANEQWTTKMQPLIDRHGDAILRFITKAYQLPWPRDGYPVHISGYTNWAGAYSTAGPLLVISSLDPSTSGESGLEVVFHESMHQWDAAINDRLAEIGGTLGKAVPEGLSHAMIWMTAGEAVRRVIPTHVPYAEANGIWDRAPNASLRAALEAAWRPYLSGQGTRDEALTALMKLAGR